VNNIDKILTSYNELLKKTDWFFDQCLKKNQNFMKCKPGCFECCKKIINVNQIEAYYIKNHLKQLETEKLKEINLNSAKKENKNCPFLSSDGLCLIFNARPLACRIEGLQVSYGNLIHDIDVKTSWCALNFKNKMPDPVYIMNSKSTEEILNALNYLFVKESGLVDRTYLIIELVN